MTGYRGEVQRILRAASVKVGDKIKAVSRGRTYVGVLMPRTELGDPDHLVLKLDNGYNIGVKVGRSTKVALLESRELPKLAVPKPAVVPDASKPRVTIVGTGGTIASRVDYRTGAVYPAFTAEDIYNAVPEIAEIANVKVVQACNVFSEHMIPELWAKVARIVAKEINDGATGVVVAHGTDTMGYTAAALSFMLQGLFRPVVLVGSQRSSDRPSSDAALNLISAVAVAAKSDIAEVTVVMHGSTEDDHCLIHRGTKVRKCHTSRRDAFQSINDIPLGMVREGQIVMFRDDYRRAGSAGRVRVQDRLEKRVALVKTTPGLPASVIKGIIASGDRGIVLEGTGLGHVPQTLFEGIELAQRRKIPVVMTSQCLWGRVDMNVYSTGRELLQLGVIPAEDMLPEVAWVKLMWVLGRTRDLERVARLMRQNLAGEITPRTRPDAFLKPLFTPG
ncbi:MAG: Glu-tRNA(Gln) amidotransferase subunit GatD [Candidatus Hadarchaeum sp.]|uniref:Glu-tRNA(Gln) amidotransferase subunit GatD n=1 Tax=Candidatus Hadarchaeum sp. TaxID=2883567 RepID=UPI003D0C080D